MKYCIISLIVLINNYASAQVYTGLIPYRAGNKYGYCDTSGKIKISPQFDEAGFFKTSEGILYNPSSKVTVNREYFYIDTAGNKVVPPGFSHIEELFIDGFLYYKVTDNTGKKGIYKDGKIIVPVKFHEISWLKKGSKANEIEFSGKEENKLVKIMYAPQFPATANKKNTKVSGSGSPEMKSNDSLFSETDTLKLKIKYAVDSIHFIEKGLAYVEKNGKPGCIVIDKLHIFSKPYTIISINLISKYSAGCDPKGKTLIVIQVEDKYFLMDEFEKFYYDQAFTDTEGNEQYIIVKDYERIGLMAKNLCYKPIPTIYDKFIDPVWFPVSKGKTFLIYRVLKNGKEALVGINGKEYFEGL